MDALELTYRLRRLGWTQARVAQACRVSPGVVNNVIYGRARAHAVASYIASLLGEDLQVVFPEQYVFRPRTSRAGVLSAQGRVNTDPQQTPESEPPA